MRHAISRHYAAPISRLAAIEAESIPPIKLKWKNTGKMPSRNSRWFKYSKHFDLLYIEMKARVVLLHKDKFHISMQVYTTTLWSFLSQNYYFLVVLNRENQKEYTFQYLWIQKLMLYGLLIQSLCC